MVAQLFAVQLRKRQVALRTWLEVVSSKCPKLTLVADSVRHPFSSVPPALRAPSSCTAYVLVAGI